MIVFHTDVWIFQVTEFKLNRWASLNLLLLSSLRDRLLPTLLWAIDRLWRDRMTCLSIRPLLISFKDTSLLSLSPRPMVFLYPQFQMALHRPVSLLVQFLNPWANFTNFVELFKVDRIYSLEQVQTPTWDRHWWTSRRIFHLDLWYSQRVRTLQIIVDHRRPEPTAERVDQTWHPDQLQFLVSTAALRDTEDPSVKKLLWKRSSNLLRWFDASVEERADPFRRLSFIRLVRREIEEVRIFSLSCDFLFFSRGHFSESIEPVNSSHPDYSRRSEFRRRAG